MNPLVYKKMIETTELKPCKLCANENTNSCIGCQYSDGPTDMLTTYPPKEKDNFHIKCCANCDNYYDDGSCKINEVENWDENIDGEMESIFWSRDVEENDYCTWGWTRRTND